MMAYSSFDAMLMDNPQLIELEKKQGRKFAIQGHKFEDPSLIRAEFFGDESIGFESSALNQEEKDLVKKCQDELVQALQAANTENISVSLNFYPLMENHVAFVYQPDGQTLSERYEVLRSGVSQLDSKNKHNSRVFIVVRPQGESKRPTISAQVGIQTDGGNCVLPSTEQIRAALAKAKELQDAHNEKIRAKIEKLKEELPSTNDEH